MSHHPEDYDYPEGLADNYDLEAHADAMAEKWEDEYGEYVTECEQNGDQPISFKDYWHEREGDI